MKSIPGFLRRGIVRPRYILAIVFILMFIMIGMGLYELSASKRDIMSVLEEEAFSLAEAISVVGDNSLLCSNMFEDMIIERLLNNAWLLEKLDHEKELSEENLKEIAEQNGIYRIYIFNKGGNKTHDSHRYENLPLSDQLSIDDLIVPLLSGAEEEIVDVQAVGVRRRKGGAIVLLLNSEEMLDLKKSMGIGILIQTIGENEGIKYIVLQDKIGLVLASKNITEMRKIEGDSFLESALENLWLDTRVYPFGDEEVLEVVSPFQIDDESYGLFRIGLSMEEVRAVEARSRQRLAITAFVVFIIGIVSLGFLLVTQNYSLLTNAYNRMQTYTGMVLENIADGIIVSDSKGIISVFNRAAGRIFGKTEPEAIGSSVKELGGKMEKTLEDASKTQIPDRSMEVMVELPEAGNRFLSIHASKFAETDTGSDSVVAVIRDVTEQKVMEENMRRTEQLTAMGKLASAVAHEVRNPLNSISMIAQRLGREFSPREGEEDYNELISTVRSESARINRIVEEFLRFARPPRLNRQPVNMEHLLRETLLLIRTQALERGIEINEDYSDPGFWNIDREQMKQVLLNLFLNGIEAMPDGGSLSVKGCKDDNGMLCIEISDTGMGISEEDLPRIFDLYFTTKETGTGLGLSIVQRVIVEHGGWLDVTSKPSSGTTFRIYLPREEKAGE